MYKKFKECLLKPSRIGLYVDDKIFKTILYFLLLLVVYILPSVVSLASTKEMPEEYANAIVESFANAEQVPYKIEDSKLVTTKDNVTTKYVVVGTLSGLDTLVIFGFDLSKESNLDNFNFDTSLIGKSILLVTFSAEKVFINGGVLELTSSNNTFNNFEQLSTTTNESMAFSYEELGIKKIDFSIARYNKTSFKEELNKLYLGIFTKNKVLILTSGISFIIFGSALSMLFEMLLLALLIKILYSKFEISYKNLCKIVILAYTPQVVFNLLSIFWSNAFMYLLGQILTVIYIMIGMRSYSANQLVKNLGDKFMDYIEEQMKKGDDENEL